MTTAPELERVTVATNRGFSFNVYVQGNLAERHQKTVILTVHDLGTNHNSFARFVAHPAMQKVRENAVFLHVCVPGQEDHAPDFVGDYPLLKDIGESLVCVLDQYDIKTCVAFGEGSGANIICRFAMSHPNRLIGVCLIHCTSTTAGLIEYCKDKLTNMRLESGVMSQGAWDYLTMHKLGADSDKAVKAAYIENLRATLNPRNLSKYLLSFTKRTDLSQMIGEKLVTVDVLLVSGAKAPHLQTVYTTQKSMNKAKTTLLVVNNVCDVMQEAPDNLARSLILLCKGCGVLAGVSIPGMDRQRTLSKHYSSMEEADRPRRVSLTPSQGSNGSGAVSPPPVAPAAAVA